MAKIIPIRGLRYNPAVIDDLSKVVTPPYDVIDEEAQNRYYESHPYNIIRLEYNHTYPGDDERTNRYTRAAATFREWCAQEVLTRETAPALYLYEQEFELRGRRLTRRGFFCAVRLEPYSTGAVRPHEETLPRAKQDRLNLLRTCRANFSPILGLYAGKGLHTVDILKAAAATAPAISFRDETDQAHRLWPVTDPRAISEVAAALEGRPVFIADGHHRYETALAYKGECGVPGLHDYAMMALVDLYDPGLVVLPAHRLVKSPRSIEPSALLSALQHHFVVSETAGDMGSLLSDLERQPKHSFVLYTGSGRLYFLHLKASLDLDELMPPGRSPNWKRLDVTVLHHLILERYLGLDSAERARGDAVVYTRDEESALARVDSGEFDYAFFQNPPGVEEMVAVAEDGERMPQKSTYFFPKLGAGLVINPLD